MRKGGVSHDYVTGQAVRMIQDMSDEKMRTFKELVATRYEAKKYLPDDFDPDAELEAARKERYGSIVYQVNCTQKKNCYEPRSLKEIIDMV